MRARRPYAALAWLASALLAALAAPPPAPASTVAEGRDTTLVTRSLSGGLPDGPSSNPAISLDQRYARLLAFESSASDLVSPSPGSMTNVYFIQRRPPYDNSGGTWLPGPIQLASTGLGAQPANGPSTAPKVSGDNYRAPACIAFISAASNLVPGDTNGRPDAFVYSLRTGRIARVSVASNGAQAAGTAYDVAVNGACTAVAFSDDAPNIVRGVPVGVGQVYVRDLVRHRTMLVSRGRHGPGNASSSQPAFAARNGELVFTSLAGNLAGATAGHSQVFERLRSGRLKMLSRTPAGAPGDGDSDQPALQQYGHSYAFRTRAPNLAAGADGASQIVYSRSGGPLAVAGATATGDSANPDLVDLGYYVLFDSADTNLGAPAGPAAAAYLYTRVRNLTLPVSVDSWGLRLNLPGSHPSSSEAANYIFFQTSDPAADLVFGVVHGTIYVPPKVALTLPPFQQVYMRYLGPK